MRILKYLFLLGLLSFIGITVYVATQKGDFEVSKSSLIKAQKSTVFDYVNDYKNWETFGSWMKKENDIRFNYPAKTMGAGAQCSWESSSGDGHIKTYFVKENDSIVQKAKFNGTNSTIYWKFKDTLNHTKVTVVTKGRMDILTKITSFFKGGIHNVVNGICEQSLHNLDKTLDYEMKTYSIKVNGIVQRKSGYCLKQTVSCNIQSISKNIKIIMPRMVYFFKKNKLPIMGKPYVRYDRYEPQKDFATISVCIPVNKQIFVSPESDITSGEMEAFTCLKTTLIGDYSHRKETWAKAEKYISDNNLKVNFAGKYIEVYSRTIDEVKQPSKWLTELYIPVFPKAEVPQAEIATGTQPTISPNTTQKDSDKSL